MAKAFARTHSPMIFVRWVTISARTISRRMVLRAAPKEAQAHNRLKSRFIPHQTCSSVILKRAN
jgi:hypothetical protein